MLTHGASQALDLAARTLVRPGDVVLVDDPGYPNLMSILRTQARRWSASHAPRPATT